MKLTGCILTIFLFCFCMLSPSYAGNITVWDRMGVTGSAEDEEVEPNCVSGQQWDLEAFVQNGNMLTMIGGYDFRNGQSDNTRTYTSGDIFFDVTGDANYGNPGIEMSGDGWVSTSNSWGYDYVIHFDSIANSTSYTIYEINSATKVKTGYYEQNQGANPWVYESGGTGVGTGFFTYQSYDNDQILNSYGVSLTGGMHNAATVDVSFLGSNKAFTAHYTYGCGNDNLVGQGTTTRVPEPATLLLLGIGLLGIPFAARLRNK